MILLSVCVWVGIGLLLGVMVIKTEFFTIGEYLLRLSLFAIGSLLIVGIWFLAGRPRW